MTGVNYFTGEMHFRSILQKNQGETSPPAEPVISEDDWAENSVDSIDEDAEKLVKRAVKKGAQIESITGASELISACASRRYRRGSAAHSSDLDQKKMEVSASSESLTSFKNSPLISPKKGARVAKRKADAVMSFRSIVTRNPKTNELKLPVNKINMENLTTALTGEPIFIDPRKVQKNDNKYVREGEMTY